MMFFKIGVSIIKSAGRKTLHSKICERKAKTGLCKRFFKFLDQIF